MVEATLKRTNPHLLKVVKHLLLHLKTELIFVKIHLAKVVQHVSMLRNMEVEVVLKVVDDVMLKSHVLQEVLLLELFFWDSTYLNYSIAYTQSHHILVSRSHTNVRCC